MGISIELFFILKTWKNRRNLAKPKDDDGSVLVLLVGGKIKGCDIPCKKWLLAEKRERGYTTLCIPRSRPHKFQVFLPINFTLHLVSPQWETVDNNGLPLLFLFSSCKEY